jgi:hypothetical protein
MPLDVPLPDNPADVKQKVLPRLGVFGGDTFRAVLFDGSIRKLKRDDAKGFLHAVNPANGLGRATDSGRGTPLPSADPARPVAMVLTTKGDVFLASGRDKPRRLGAAHLLRPEGSGTPSQAPQQTGPPDGLSRSASQPAVPTAELVFHLSNSGESVVEQTGRDLETLRRLRNRSDYDEAPSVTQPQAAAAVQLAEGIIQVLDAAGQEPARTRIRDAMIVYERGVLHDVTWRP